MAFDVSTLSTYTNGYGAELVAKMVARSGQVASVAQIIPDIKSAESIPLHNTTLYLTAGACGWNPSGTTVMGTMVLSVAQLQYQEQLCVQTAEKYQMQWEIAAGSMGEDVNFAEKFVGEKLAQIALANENMAWQASTTVGTGNNSFLNGFIHLATLTSCSASTVTVSGYTGVSSSNVIALMDAMVTQSPAAIRTQNDLVLFCGLDVFQTYVIALRTANLFYYDVTGDNLTFKLRIPGSPVTVIGTPGLSGGNPITSKQNLFLTSASNMYLGCDIFDESNRAHLWYSQDFSEVRFQARYKLGYNIAFCSFVVIHNT